MKISFCYILWNAGKVIEDSLNSILAHVKREDIHEIVIALDTKTTDNTREVLCKWASDNNINVNVYEYKWETNSFAAARNFAHSQATGDWVFWIDGDEKILRWEDLPDSSDYVIALTEQKFEGKPISRLTGVRAFKRHLNCEFENMLHETLPIKQFIGFTGFQSYIIIENKEKSIGEVREKAKWLLETHYEQLRLEPENQYIRGQIAYCYRAMGDYNTCLDFAFMSLTMDKDDFYNGTTRKLAPGKAQITNLIGECYVNLGKTDIAKHYFALSLKFCPDQLGANVMLYNLADDIQIKEVFKKEILRVGDNSKVQFDVLFENIKPLIEA